MKIHIRALALTVGFGWAGAILIVSLFNLASNSYGLEFLKLVASIYPGFHVSGSFIDVLVGALYGFVDGLFGGAILGWLYNFIVDRKGT